MGDEAWFKEMDENEMNDSKSKLNDELSCAATGKENKVCGCSMRIRLVGDGCSKCNPEMAQQIEEDNAFDEWWDGQKFKGEDHNQWLASDAWAAAIDWAKKAR